MDAQFSESKYLTPNRVKRYFKGRNEALRKFYECFPNKHMQNGVYFTAPGGQGKTWLLWKIQIDQKDFPGRKVSSIIDFFDTTNQSTRGLQASIQQRLDDGSVYKPYEKAVEELDKIRLQKPDPGTMVSLERRLNLQFIECTKKAVSGKEVVLLFDTFERVHQREVGEWLLNNFLDQVKDLVVAIAGRPSSSILPLTQGIEEYALPGLDETEISELVLDRWPDAGIDRTTLIFRATSGSPLLARLILEMTSPSREALVDQLINLPPDKKMVDDPDLMNELLQQFALLSPRNVALWSMAYLKRSFSLDLLKKVAKKEPTILSNISFDGLYRDLRNQFYIKESSEPGIHMLHDQVRELLAQYHPGDEAYHEQLKAKLLDLAIDLYYPEKIKEAEAEVDRQRQEAKDWLSLIRAENILRQLRSEQFGYILDQNIKNGLQKYEKLREEISRSYDYDLEELLWGELKDHLSSDNYEAYNHYRNRGQWLREQGLFRKAELHFQEMSRIFLKDKVSLSDHINVLRYLGFMQMRQGHLSDAETTYKRIEALTPPENIVDLGVLQNLWGQLAFQQGRWDQAMDYHDACFTSAAESKNNNLLISTYLNRANLHSNLGQYDDAKQECMKAIKLLNEMPPEESEGRENRNRRVVAFTYLGMVARHEQNFDDALKYYDEAFKLSQRDQNHEARCNILEHTGITYNLMGRSMRKRNEWVEAVRQQQKAWRYLTEAINMADRTGWDPALADGLNRLAKVYREIYRLDTLGPTNDQNLGFRIELSALQSEACGYNPPIETGYQTRLLLPQQSIKETRDWLIRSAQMFDLSVWAAIDSKQFHRALESLTELSRELIELHEFQSLPRALDRIKLFQDLSYETKMFESLSLLAKGDELYEKGEWNQSLLIYSKAYRQLADLTGYALYRLQDRLDDLEWHLDKLPKDETVRWCVQLENDWRPYFRKQPKMRKLLESVRLKVFN